jgi:hypothetical protein
MEASPKISNLQYLDRIPWNHSQSNQTVIETNNFERNSGQESGAICCRPVTLQMWSRANRLNRKGDWSSWYQNSRKWKERVRTYPRPQLLGHQYSNSKAISVDKKNQLDVIFCILYFSSNSSSTCFGQPCAHHQELTTAWCYSLVLVCAVAAGMLSRPVGR